MTAFASLATQGSILDQQETDVSTRIDVRGLDLALKSLTLPFRCAGSLFVSEELANMVPIYWYPMDGTDRVDAYSHVITSHFCGLVCHYVRHKGPSDEDDNLLSRAKPFRE